MAATAREPVPKSLAKAGLVTRRGNVITVADSSIDVAAYIAATVLAGAARAVVVVFAMEQAKLVTAA